jgi:SHS2 domain-containing protein
VGRPRFRTLAHRADLRVAVWGDGEQELIRNAVLAAMSLALGAAPGGRPTRLSPIRPWRGDLASRLVRAVNESLFILYARREVAVRCDASERGAVLALAPLPAGAVPALEIKAATYHDLHPRRRLGRLRAILTLDV